MHGFDSFEGLPEAWGNNPAGAYSTHGQLPKVPANVTLHMGFFSDSLPHFVAAHGGPVRLLHIDCDLYSSTATVFDHLDERIGTGTVIIFDEYIASPRWREDEFRAFQEAVERNGWSYDYLAFNLFTRQAAVIIA